MSKIKLEKGAVFERYETKYRLNARQYEAINKQLSPHMARDEYGEHTICTIYYDTDDFAIIRHCLDKPKFREKLRLRSYGTPSLEDTVYLELKKKSAGITYKRRISLKLKEANDYMKQAGHVSLPQSQIFKEIDWFTHQQELSPKVILCYDRIALFGKEDAELRITFDSNIRWRDYNVALEKGDYGSPLLEKGEHLMEIKTTNALPYWLAQILSQNEIYPTSFSKYGTIYKNYLNQKEEILHAV